jgi:hypothetical protein
MTTTTMPPDHDLIRSTLLALAATRQGKSFCPSEAARSLADNWRPLMPAIRQCAADLANLGLLTATRRGQPVDPLASGGPIRLSLPPDSAAPGLPAPGSPPSPPH